MKEITIKEGVLTTDSVPQLNINKLIKSYYIKEGGKGEGNFQNKDNDPELYLVSDCTTSERLLIIKYELLNGTGIMEYKIKIEALISNLGKGVTLYFICPVSGERATILYYCFKSEMFIHRKAYPQRIYYPIQLKSKVERVYEAYSFNTEKLFNLLWINRKKTYQGKITKKQKQIGVFIDKRKLLDKLILQRSEDFLNRRE